MIDATDIRAGRKRDGEQAQDREDRVEEILSEKERVGFGTEKPLLEREYEAYPDRDELFRPSNNDVKVLAQHDYVNNAEDIAKELNVSEETVEKVANIHGVDLPDEDSSDIEVTRLEKLVGNDLPSEMVSHENPVCLTVLYLGYGLSIDEIVTIFNEEDNRNVTAKAVRQSLVDCHVIKGKTTQELERKRRETRGEVNRATHGGISIDASDF